MNPTDDLHASNDDPHFTLYLFTFLSYLDDITIVSISKPLNRLLGNPCS